MCKRLNLRTSLFSNGLQEHRVIDRIDVTAVGVDDHNKNANNHNDNQKKSNNNNTASQNRKATETQGRQNKCETLLSFVF